MSLAQLKGFSPRNPYRKKLSVDMPVFDEKAALLYRNVLRKKFANASKDKKKEMYELMSEAVIHLWLNSGGRGKRDYTKTEQMNFWKIARIYNELKQEFAREVL